MLTLMKDVFLVILNYHLQISDLSEMEYCEIEDKNLIKAIFRFKVTNENKNLSEVSKPF